MAKQDTKLNELITFGAIILFMVGAIFFYKGDSNETSTVYGDNIIWADFHDTQMDIWLIRVRDMTQESTTEAGAFVEVVQCADDTYDGAETCSSLLAAQ